MKLHANAALSLKGRRQLAVRVTEEGWSLGEAAEAAETSERTAGKWSARYRVGGERALLDRSSAPHRVHNRNPAARVAVIKALRGLRSRLRIPEMVEIGIDRSSAISGPEKLRGGPSRRAQGHRSSPASGRRSRRTVTAYWSSSSLSGSPSRCFRAVYRLPSSSSTGLRCRRAT